MNSPVVTLGRASCDEGVEILNNAYFEMMHVNNRNRNKLYLTLSNESIKMASTLFLNIYEIKLFQSTYLMMWSSDTSNPYVPRNTMESFIDPSYSGFIRSYFQTENNISFNSFFIFSCFFLFFDDSHILSLLLSLCHIHSHIIINRAQIESFYRSFNLNRKDINTLLSLLKNSQKELSNCKSDTYQMKVFIQYFQHSPYFTNTLTLFRCELINKIIGVKNYNIISQKMFYYYHNNNSSDNNTKVIHESCFTRFYNQYILHRPSYYYADYTILHPKKKDIEDIAYMIRQKYGYSQRSHSSLLPINVSDIVRQSNTVRTSKSTINHNIVNYKNSSILFNNKKIICKPPSCNSFPIDGNISSYTSDRNEKNSSSVVKSPDNSSPYENDTCNL